MSARTKRHEHATGISDPHALIASEAAQIRAGGSIAQAGAYPGVNALLDSARAALERGIPARFEHEGRTYFVRASIGLVRLEVFDSVTACEPITTAMSGSVDSFGHTPGH